MPQRPHCRSLIMSVPITGPSVMTSQDRKERSITGKLWKEAVTHKTPFSRFQLAQPTRCILYPLKFLNNLYTDNPKHSLLKQCNLNVISTQATIARSARLNTIEWIKLTLNTPLGTAVIAWTLLPKLTQLRKSFLPGQKKSTVWAFCWG